MVAACADPEEEYLRQCVAKLADGQPQAILLDDLAPRLRALGPAGARRLLAAALAPRLAPPAAAAGARGGEAEAVNAEAARCAEHWARLLTAAAALSALTCAEPWGGQGLASALLAASARAVVDAAGPQTMQALMDSQLAAFVRFRADPDALGDEALGALGRFAALLAAPAAEGHRRRYIAALCEQSAEASRRAAGRSLEALAAGGPAESWASRLACCVEVEQAIEGLHSGATWDTALRGRLAASCAAAWQSLSTALLPWILAWLLAPGALAALRRRGAAAAAADAPAVGADEAELAECLGRLCAGLGASSDASALRGLVDALAAALTLLLQLALAPAAALEPAAVVAWMASVLDVAHVACQELVPDVPAAMVAAALAPKVAAVIGPGAEPLGPPVAPPSTGDQAGSAMDVARLTPRLVDAAAEWARARRRALGAAVTELGRSPAAALALAIHEEVCAHREAERAGKLGAEHWGQGGWPPGLAPLLLILHLLPDAGGAPLALHAWLAGLRVLRAEPGERPREEQPEGLEQRLWRFLRQECGAGNRVLRHLGELGRDAAGRGALAGGGATCCGQPLAPRARFCSECGQAVQKVESGWRAVITAEATASGAGLGLAEALSLGAVPPLLFQASQPLAKQLREWTLEYGSRFAHRKLRWQPLFGSALLLWHHTRGKTELIASELQAHVLLIFNTRRKVSEAELRVAAQDWSGGGSPEEAERAWALWSRALAALCGSGGPLERVAEEGGATLVARPAPFGDVGARLLELDGPGLLASVSAWAALAGGGAAEAGAEQDAESRGPAIDAAVVRLLKRWHVLTATELVAKLACYPKSLELAGSGATPAAAFSIARSAAGGGGAEAHARARKLGERGLIRIEPAEEAEGPAARYFYVD